MFGQGAAAFGRGTASFGQGTASLGQGTAMFGRGTASFGQGTASFGTVPANAEPVRGGHRRGATPSERPQHRYYVFPELVPEYAPPARPGKYAPAEGRESARSRGQNAAAAADTTQGAAGDNMRAGANARVGAIARGGESAHNSESAHNGVSAHYSDSARDGESARAGRSTNSSSSTYGRSPNNPAANHRRSPNSPTNASGTAPGHLSAALAEQQRLLRQAFSDLRLPSSALPIRFYLQPDKTPRRAPTHPNNAANTAPTDPHSSHPPATPQLGSARVLGVSDSLAHETPLQERHTSDFVNHQEQGGVAPGHPSRFANHQGRVGVAQGHPAHFANQEGHLSHVVNHDGQPGYGAQRVAPSQEAQQRREGYRGASGAVLAVPQTRGLRLQGLQLDPSATLQQLITLTSSRRQLQALLHHVNADLVTPAALALSFAHLAHLTQRAHAAAASHAAVHTGLAVHAGSAVQARSGVRTGAAVRAGAAAQARLDAQSSGLGTQRSVPTGTQRSVPGGDAQSSMTDAAHISQRVAAEQLLPLLAEGDWRRLSGMGAPELAQVAAGLLAVEMPWAATRGVWPRLLACSAGQLDGSTPGARPFHDCFVTVL